MAVCLTNGNYVEGKYLFGKNTSDWAIGWCNERKAYLFVCYLGRVSNDCRKLKSKKLVAICWELGGSGSSRWPKQTASPVCHLSAYGSPAFLGSFNPCHLTLPGMISTLSEGRSPGSSEDIRWCSAWLREGKKINGCKLGLAWLGWKRSLGSTWV